MTWPVTAVVADTHALLWYLTAPEMLSFEARSALVGATEAGREIVVASVSLIELVHVAEKRSDSIDSSTVHDVLRLVDEPSSPFTLHPLSTDVAGEMIMIPRTTVRDPFDRAIVATARASGCRLVTRDALLTTSFPELCLW